MRIGATRAIRTRGLQSSSIALLKLMRTFFSATTVIHYRLTNNINCDGYLSNMRIIINNMHLSH